MKTRIRVSQNDQTGLNISYDSLFQARERATSRPQAITPQRRRSVLKPTYMGGPSDSHIRFDMIKASTRVSRRLHEHVKTDRLISCRYDQCHAV